MLNVDIPSSSNLNSGLQNQASSQNQAYSDEYQPSSQNPEAHQNNEDLDDVQQLPQEIINGQIQLFDEYYHNAVQNMTQEDEEFLENTPNTATFNSNLP